MIDCIIIGGGIAGASSAYALKQKGLKPLVLEKNTICSGGSYPAGAFLSPKISKPSPYKTYLNDSLKYSLEFYAENFPNLLKKDGLLKLPIDHEDIHKCQTYEPYIDIAFEKQNDNYYFPDAGIIDPVKLIKELLKDIDIIERHEVKNIKHIDNIWHVDKYQAKYLILATGSETLPLNIPYLKTKNIGGYRYDVCFDQYEKLQYNLHKSVSISTYFENKIAIGASHIKGDIDLEKAAKDDNYNLIKQALEIRPLPNLKILKQYTGYRNFSFDYFPILGEAVDAKQTIKKYPYITTGAKVPQEKYTYFTNLYIHKALGSRGFVFAPYNAKLLADLICNQKKIPNHLSPAKRFTKWARKQTL